MPNSLARSAIRLPHIEPERLSSLIGDIYDAALDPALWVGVLAKSAAFVGGRAASLYSKDVAKGTAVDVYQYGLYARYVQLYQQKYIKFNPTTLGYFIADIERPVSTVDAMPYGEFLASRFYKEWGKPQGLVDTVHAMLDKSITSAAALVGFRHGRDGLIDDETRQRVRLVVPHFRRAMLIGKVIDLKKAEAASLADTLDGISAGMFLVDAAGRIVHGNAAGRQWDMPTFYEINGSDYASGGRATRNKIVFANTFSDCGRCERPWGQSNDDRNGLCPRPNLKAVSTFARLYNVNRHRQRGASGQC